MLEIVNDTDVDFERDVFDTIFEWMKDDCVFEQDAQCTLKLSKNNEIKELNHRYRGRDSVTDVLTFPCEIKNIPFKGDIIIDIEQADKQKGNHSLKKELAFLFIHGLLHLAGFDHLAKRDQTRMAMYENKYRLKLGLM